MSLRTSEGLCLSKRWTISWLCLVAQDAADKKTTEILTVCVTKSAFLAFGFDFVLQKKMTFWPWGSGSEILRVRRRAVALCGIIEC